MKTYIRKNIKRYYVEFPEEIDAQYWAGKIGTTYQDFRDGKWVLLSDEQVAFHNEYPSASISEVLNMELSQSTPIEETIENVKADKIAEIENYDSSSNVNSFTINEQIESWLTPAERANYKNSIEAAELMGIENVSFYVNDTEITLPVNTAKLMLAQIQLYADNCFIVTKQNIQAVQGLDSIEAVKAYAFESNYPAKLNFNIA